MATPEVESLILKAIGSVAGTILALLFWPPRTWGGFFRRGWFSAISGVVFAAPVREIAQFPVDAEGLIAGGCAAAALSWFIMSAATRIIKAYRQE